MKNNGTDSQFPGRHFKHEMSARKQRKNTNHMTATSWQVRSLLAVLTRSFRQKVLRSLSLLVAEIIMVDFLLATNLTHFFRCIYLCHFSTCFEQHSVHHQENRIVSIHHLVLSLCVGDCLVCQSGRNFLTGIPGSHLHRVMYTRWCIDTIRFSWCWALGCSKHVEKWHK